MWWIYKCVSVCGFCLSSNIPPVVRTLVWSAWIKCDRICHVVWLMVLLRFDRLRFCYLFQFPMPPPSSPPALPPTETHAVYRDEHWSCSVMLQSRFLALHPLLGNWKFSHWLIYRFFTSPWTQSKSMCTILLDCARAPIRTHTNTRTHTLVEAFLPVYSLRTSNNSLPTFSLIIFCRRLYFGK